MLSNSPSVRRLACTEGRSGALAAAMYFTHKQPPFSSVYALFRSMGYRLCRGQRFKWEGARLGNWVPFEMEKDGARHVRWVMNGYGPLKWSDGSDLPRKLLISYAAAKARFEKIRNARKIPAEPEPEKAAA